MLAANKSLNTDHAPKTDESNKDKPQCTKHIFTGNDENTKNKGNDENMKNKGNDENMKNKGNKSKCSADNVTRTPNGKISLFLEDISLSLSERKLNKFL